MKSSEAWQLRQSAAACAPSSAKPNFAWSNFGPTFAGFQAGPQPTPACSGDIITHVSPDGKTVAVFGKSCSLPNTYFCNAVNVNDEAYKPIKPISATSIPDDKVDCTSI